MTAWNPSSLALIALGAACALCGCQSARICGATVEPRPSGASIEVARDLGRPELLGVPESVAVAPRTGWETPPRAWLTGGPEGAPADGGAGGDDLAKKSADPTQPLLTFSLNEWYSPSSHQLDGDDDWNTLVFRAVVPFKTGCVQQIARFNQPFLTDAPGNVHGVGDLTVFDLAVFKGCGFTYGLGADVTVPWGDENVTSHKWSGGPAAVLMVPTGKWLFGALVQNYFSFAGESGAPDIAQTILQPIAVLGLGNGRTIGLSELIFAYDWNKSDWVSAPFGLSFAQLVKIGGKPVKFSISADYNFIDTQPGPDWTVRLGVALILP